MPNDTNIAVMIGRLTRDPELMYTQNGKAKCAFSLAVDYGYTQNGERKEQVSFFNWISWGKLGEALAKFCRKGHRILVRGRAQQRTWEDKEGGKHVVVEFIVEGFQFLQPKSKGAEDQGADMTPQGGEPPPFFEDVPPGEGTWPGDDIPF